MSLSIIDFLSQKGLRKANNNISLSLVPSGNGYKFKSRKRLRLFLDLELPYDACLECGLPLSKSALSKSKTEIPDLLSMLVESAVPSPEAADFLHDLSNAVICRRKGCRKQAPLLYKTWCDKLWTHYLRVHELNLEDCGSRPIGFTKEEWESALEEDDSASDSAYGSNDDDPDSDYDSDTDSDEDGSTDGDEDTDIKALGFESLSIKSKARPKSKPSFSKYLQRSPDNQRKALFNLMIRNISSSKNRCSGYIYGFRRPDLHGYIKIGYVKDEPKDKSQIKSVEKPVKKRLVKTRLAEWRTQCKHEIIEVFSARIECDAIQRIESLIHTTLHEYRRKQNPPCESCRKQGRGGRHDEWFKVDKNMAIKVVNFWARFAQLQPYKNGRLTNFWYEDINFQMFSGKFPEDYPITSWMAAMTPLIDLLAERKSPGRWKV